MESLNIFVDQQVKENLDQYSSYSSRELDAKIAEVRSFPILEQCSKLNYAFTFEW